MCLLSATDGARGQWIGRFFTNIQAHVWGVVDSCSEYLSLREQNDKLSESNFDLQTKLFRFEHEGSFVDPAPRGNFTFMKACVVTMTTGSQHNYIIIDKGAADGICKDDGIISEKGIIGIVQSVTENYAYALSLANVDMTVSARVGKDGAVGTIRWNGGSVRRVNLSGIPIHCEIQPNDTIYSSGFSTIFPSSIPLGRVISSKADNGNSREAELELFEDISTLKYVTLVRNTERKQIQSLIQEAEQ